MNKERYTCGIDIGTGSVRVGIFDLNGVPVQFSTKEYPTYFPRPGWAEQEPEQWWTALKRASRECLSKARIDQHAVTSLSVTATSATVFPADKEGNPLRKAILWMDSRAYKEVESIKRTKHRVLKYSGGEDALEWMVPKVLWLKRNEPEIYKKADRIFDCLDWILYKLTGRWTGSICNTTVAWNYVKPLGGWERDFFCAIGLSDLLPKWPCEVLFMGDHVGGLTPNAAKLLGLCSGISVAEGGIDSHAGMIGLGVVRPGKLAMIIGSSTSHLALSSQPTRVPGVWGPFPEAVIRKYWLLQAGQNSTGSVISWFTNLLGGARPKSGESYAALDLKASKIAPGSGGLVLLDDWQGNRSPYRDPLARGAIVGLSLGHNEGHVFRAILEGTAYGSRNILERCASRGIPIAEIRACGGGVKSDLWLQIHADVCNVAISRTKVREASTLGAAICAAVGAGIYPTIEAASANMVHLSDTIRPNRANAKQYNFYYEQYKDAYKNLNHISHAIARHRDIESMSFARSVGRALGGLK